MPDTTNDAETDAEVLDEEEAEAVRARGLPCSAGPRCVRGPARAECREDDIPF